ncbi:hypothetical protein HU200_010230 [Digitaria exilis]|uniref:Uncharacterized protein n=1 Tax=Digitaria exilis TaxID=1010633 RepID=A0A835KNF6_9POAL|nr:hypothetical protein HU200_010230 [Digitaria exilis]
MAEGAQSAVDALLGTLASVVRDEARLLGGVRGDVEFIKEEMEIMHGFLRDASDAAGETSNQVDALTRQIRLLASDSQNSIDRYVQTFGGGLPSEAGSLRRLPQLVRTMPDRHRIAKEIRKLKARAREVGERRRRYGIAVLSAATPRDHHHKQQEEPPSLQHAGGGEAAELQAARRRRVLARAMDLLDMDASAREVTAWLSTSGGDRQMQSRASFAEYLKDLVKHPAKLYDLMRSLQSDEAIGALIETVRETAKEERRVMHDWFTRLIGVSAAGRRRPEMNSTKPSSSGEDHHPHHQQHKSPSPVTGGLAAIVGKAVDPIGIFERELKYVMEVLLWLCQVFHKSHRRGLILAIVTPPVDAHDQENDLLGTCNPATELARRVYDQSKDGRFDCKAWIDAGVHRQPVERLRCLLRQVRRQQEAAPAAGSPPESDETSTWDEPRLREEVKRHLKDKRFLIVLADHEDDSPWSHITPALPDDYPDHSAIIVTPVIRTSIQFHGWCIASWLFVHNRLYHYKVHFYPHFEAVAAEANELLLLLLGGSHGRRRDRDDLQLTVREILKKCRRDSSTTRMFIRALDANPHWSNAQLLALLDQLRDFGKASNARHIIGFCYNHLPTQYKSCLLYLLSILPPGSKIRRTRLVRRWVAENLISTRHPFTEANRCFDVLVRQGLVLPCDIGPEERVKTCKVDPHVASFITNMALQENVIGRSTGLPPDLASRLSIRDGIQLQQLYDKALRYTGSQTCWSWRVRSHTSPVMDSRDPSVCMAKFLNSLPASPQWGLVKVLDLEGCSGLNKHIIRNICNKIFQLKYLSLRKTDVIQLPSEISKLQDMETFDIRETKVRSFSTKMIALQRLVHLLAGHTGHHPSRYKASGSSEPFSTIQMPSGIGSFGSMQVLSSVEVSQSTDVKELDGLGQLLHLRKLSVVIIPCKEANNILSHLLRAIAKLDGCLSSLSVHLQPVGKQDADAEIKAGDDATISPPSSLESLTINGNIKGILTWLKELHQLSKLTLSRTALKDTDI